MLMSLIWLVTAAIQTQEIYCQTSYSLYLIHFNGISHSVESPHIFLVICANRLIHLITKRHVAFPSSPVLDIFIKMLPIVMSPVKDFESLKCEGAFSKFIPKAEAGVLKQISLGSLYSFVCDSRCSRIQKLDVVGL